MDYFEAVETAQAIEEAFEGSTLILPQPSLGSVAQLACDLVIHSGGFELVGHLGLRDYVPTISSNESPFVGPCLGTQVFVNRAKNWTVVLPRSPVIKARTQAHLDSLAAFVRAARFARVLVVSGTDAAARADDALRLDSPFRQLVLSPSPSPSPSSSATTSEASATGKAAWDRLRSTVEPYSTQRTEGGIPLIPAGGMTRRALEALSTSTSTSSTPTAALMACTADGDNRQLAHSLASTISSVLSTAAAGGEGATESISWREPASWTLGLAGRELSRESRSEIYG